MKIAILGTRGIPNNYGGFEQFAEFFSKYLTENNHDVYVFNSHDHLYQEKTWEGVNIVHKFDPEYLIGTAGQFFYDLACILYCRKEKFDIILQLGYTSSSIWSFLFPKKSLVFTNMDGLEWKRSKYNAPVRYFLRFAEKWAAKYSDYLIADSIGIQTYLKSKYNKESEFIAYGADVFSDPNEKVLEGYNLTKEKYGMLVARMEPENNIETILDGVHESDHQNPFLVIGKINKFASYLQEKYKNDSRIRFMGPIYNLSDLNNIRYYSRYYFHGHSVGGTNPSLLEAMASNALIIAHNNPFNKAILNEDAAYFDNNRDVKDMLNKDEYFASKGPYTENNKNKITMNFSWSTINSKYEEYLIKGLQEKAKNS